MRAAAVHRQKDGHGCLFRQRYFVIAGGEWCYGVTESNTTQPYPPCIPDTRTHMYDLTTHEWSVLPPPSYTMFRTSGACGKDELFLVSGMSPNNTAVPRGLVDAARLTMTEGSDGAPRWKWTMLPPLPKGGNRWLGAAAAVDGWLVIAAGANECGFESSELTAGSGARVGHDVCNTPCTDGARCPPWLPSFRLKLSGPNGFAERWEPVARFPGGGLDVPNTAVAGGSMYIFGGCASLSISPCRLLEPSSPTMSGGDHVPFLHVALDPSAHVACGVIRARQRPGDGGVVGNVRARPPRPDRGRHQRRALAPLRLAVHAGDGPVGGAAGPAAAHVPGRDDDAARPIHCTARVVSHPLKNHFFISKTRLCSVVLSWRCGHLMEVVGRRAHGKNSFRVGSTNPIVTRSPLASAPRGVTVYADIPVREPHTSLAENCHRIDHESSSQLRLSSGVWWLCVGISAADGRHCGVLWRHGAGLRHAHPEVLARRRHPLYILCPRSSGCRQITWLTEDARLLSDEALTDVCGLGVGWQMGW